jgi:hypothetical protein
VTEGGRSPSVAAAHDRFGLLLVLLLALFVVSSLRESVVTRAVAAVLYVVAVGVSARATAVRSFRWAPLLVGIGVVGLAAVALSPFEGGTATGVAAVLQGIMVAGTLAAVLGRIVQHREVTGQTIAGALCAYLLIGFLFSFTYAAADELGSTPIFGRAADVDDYSYFSFVTLTTLGYGDLAPATDLIRRVAVIEAMAGQIFLATMIARLMSLFRRPDRR